MRPPLFERPPVQIARGQLARANPNWPATDRPGDRPPASNIYFYGRELNPDRLFFPICNRLPGRFAAVLTNVLRPRYRFRPKLANAKCQGRGRKPPGAGFTLGNLLNSSTGCLGVSARRPGRQGGCDAISAPARVLKRRSRLGPFEKRADDDP